MSELQAVFPSHTGIYSCTSYYVVHGIGVTVVQSDAMRENGLGLTTKCAQIACVQNSYSSTHYTV